MNRCLLLLLIAFVFIGSPVFAQGESPDEILDILADRPGSFSLVVYSLDDPGSGIYHRANVMRPLATTVKVLVLTEYARRVASGALDPDEIVPLDSVEAYYFSGTDRGAHDEAVTALRSAGRLENNRLTVSEIADAMIRYNDNAAADYLMVRFGRAAMDALPEVVGLRYTTAPVPISGIYLNWDLPFRLGDDVANSYTQEEDRAWYIAKRLRSGEDFSNEMQTWMEGMNTRMSYGELSAAALAFPAGSARAYASLMASAFQGELISDRVSEIMADVLDYEMDDPGIRFLFNRILATKSGSLAGVLTDTYVADGKPAFEGGPDAPPAVLALFMESLDEELFEQMLGSEALTIFELRLLTDPEYRETVRDRLAD